MATGCEVTTRYPTINVYGNWALGMHELYYRNPEATHFAMFQDDILVCSNLREYLEQSNMPENGYMNLYSMPINEKLAPTDYSNGRWYPSNQQGYGAVALVFSRKMLHNLLSNREWLERPMAPNNKGHRSIDGGICHVLSIRYAGQFQEFCHAPCLTQHIGRKSTIGHQFLATPETFPGEEFDALTLASPKVDLPEEIAQVFVPPGMFNNSYATPKEMAKAFSILGLTVDQVYKWATALEESNSRQKRCNKIGWLAREVISGRVDEARERFQQLLN